MPLLGATLLSQMIADIKVEARINGSDDLNVTILAIINEVLLAEIEASRYSWLLIEDSPIVVVAAQGKYQLPADFLNIKAVRFARAAEGGAYNGRVLREKNGFVERSRDGSEPNYYELTGNMLSVFPYGGILLGDFISIDYWAQPNALVMGDTFPIPKLYPIVKRKVVSRAHAINKDLTAAQLYDKSGQEQQAKSMTSEDNVDTQ